MYDLAGNLARVRKEKKLTQRQVAKEINISERVYQSYEYGKVIPSALVLISLADLFDVSIDYLVGRSEDPSRH